MSTLKAIGNAWTLNTTNMSQAKSSASPARIYRSNMPKLTSVPWRRPRYSRVNTITMPHLPAPLRHVAVRHRCEEASLHQAFVGSVVVRADAGPVVVGQVAGVADGALEEQARAQGLVFFFYECEAPQLLHSFHNRLSAD